MTLLVGRCAVVLCLGLCALPVMAALDVHLPALVSNSGVSRPVRNKLMQSSTVRSGHPRVYRRPDRFRISSETDGESPELPIEEPEDEGDEGDHDDHPTAGGAAENDHPVEDATATNTAPEDGTRLDANSVPWQWDIMARDMLEPWTRINKEKVDLAEKRVTRAVTAFRAQVISGRLYITDLRALWFARQFTASAKLTLMAVLRNFPGEIPDIDIVVNQGDYPVAQLPKDLSMLQRHYGEVAPFALIFSPTTARNTLDLQWPDFSFMPPLGDHELKTPRWDVARRSVLEAGERIPWANKLDLAAWTGNTQAEPRQWLSKVARERPDVLFVNSIYFKTPAGRTSCEKAGLGGKGGYQEQKCSMSFEELCRYRYLVNVGSNGYANKLKYLFLCQSVVIFVHQGSPNHEFFESQLTAGMHYYGVQKVADVPAAVEYLRQNPTLARTIAEAGTARMRQLDFKEVTNYLRAMFVEYNRRMDYTPTVDPRAFEVNCEDDLWRHYNINGELLQFLTRDNSTCLRQPRPEDIKAPGWGGYWNGTSGPSCEVANDLPEVPDACDIPKPRY